MQCRFKHGFGAMAIAALLASMAVTAAAQDATKPQHASVQVSKKDRIGAYLTDGKGMSLYMFEKDGPNHSTCHDDCARAWPPLLTQGAPGAGAEVDKSKLATIKRPDGTTQVTYAGMPLYYYAKDTAPGEVKGQDVEEFGADWYLVSPDGKPNEAEDND
jgi:predicted lipoprotein with Yx(FWY)xxD motif